MRPMKSVFVLVVVMMATLGVRADGERSLPSFSVTSASGAVVTSSALSSQPRWILIYASTGCRSCDRLLESLKQWQSPALASRTVIVVGGSDGARYVADHQSSDLAASWYLDQGDDARRRLDLKGAPALIGIEHGEVRWTISGVLNDPNALESVVRKWVEY